jgi:PLP dependent protein
VTAMIHSLDSLRLAESLEEEAGGPVPVPVLLEVNLSGEAAKHGFAPEEVESALMQLAGSRHLKIRGLMGMAGLEGGMDAARRQFAGLRCLRDRLRQNCPAGIGLDELSMGMSGDYEAAIEEGATIVRVGSALFEGE